MVEACWPTIEKNSVNEKGASNRIIRIFVDFPRRHGFPCVEVDPRSSPETGLDAKTNLGFAEVGIELQPA